MWGLVRGKLQSGRFRGIQLAAQLDSIRFIFGGTSRARGVRYYLHNANAKVRGLVSVPVGQIDLSLGRHASLGLVPVKQGQAAFNLRASARLNTSFSFVLAWQPPFRADCGFL
jgi:hypothetical protein